MASSLIRRSFNPIILKKNVPKVTSINTIRCLNLQEYQSKQIMENHSLNVQKFRVVDSVESAFKHLVSKDADFTCNEYVIKAQVLAGGRGKGHFKKSGLKGGVKLTKDAQEAVSLTGQMLNDHLITHQTTSEGILVSKVMIAEALDIDQEFYLAILLDRAMNGPVLVASKYGGVNIEEVAEKNPDAIKKFPLPITKGNLSLPDAVKMVQQGLDISDDAIAHKAAEQVIKLHSLFLDTDALQIEINPLGVTPQKQVVCFDAKLDFDENAEFRQKWLEPYAKECEKDEDGRILKAKEFNLNFIPMESGNIGCLVNGAGLAMATMDIISLKGGLPANFLDVGGGVTQAGVERAFQLITADPKVTTILVNIFGGIVNCGKHSCSSLRVLLYIFSFKSYSIFSRLSLPVYVKILLLSVLPTLRLVRLSSNVNPMGKNRTTF